MSVSRQHGAAAMVIVRFTNNVRRNYAGKKPIGNESTINLQQQLAILDANVHEKLVFIASFNDSSSGVSWYQIHKRNIIHSPSLMVT